MITRFIYLLETNEKQKNKKNKDKKIVPIDGLEHQSWITKLVRPNTNILIISIAFYHQLLEIE